MNIDHHIDEPAGIVTDASYTGSIDNTEAVIVIVPETEKSDIAPDTEKMEIAPETEKSDIAPDTEKSDIAPDTEKMEIAPETKVALPHNDEPAKQTSSISSQQQEEQRLRELVLRQQLTAKARSPRPGNNKSVIRLPTQYVRIDNFQRPWNIRNFQKWLGDKLSVNIVDSQVWVNAIKTHCYIDFESIDLAEKCIKAVSGVKYPDTSTLELVGNFTVVSAGQAPTSSEAAMKPIEWLSGSVTQTKQQQSHTQHSQPAPAVVTPAIVKVTHSDQQQRATVSATTSTGSSVGNSTGTTNVFARLGAGAGASVDLVRRAALLAADSAKSAPQLGAGTDRLRPTKHKQQDEERETAQGSSHFENDHQQKKRKLSGSAVAIEHEENAAAGMEDDEEVNVSLEDLFKKTTATPALFWLPVNEVEASRRKELGTRYTSLYIYSVQEEARKRQQQQQHQQQQKQALRQGQGYGQGQSRGFGQRNGGESRGNRRNGRRGGQGRHGGGGGGPSGGGPNGGERWSRDAPRA